MKLVKEEVSIYTADSNQSVGVGQRPCQAKSTLDVAWLVDSEGYIHSPVHDNHLV